MFQRLDENVESSLRAFDSDARCTVLLAGPVRKRLLRPLRALGMQVIPEKLSDRILRRIGIDVPPPEPVDVVIVDASHDPDAAIAIIERIRSVDWRLPVLALSDEHEVCWRLEQLDVSFMSPNAEPEQIRNAVSNLSQFSGASRTAWSFVGTRYANTQRLNRPRFRERPKAVA